MSTPFNANHIAVLTAVAAPAILTNASSVLCLGIGNRIARVIDRTRAVAAAEAQAGANTKLHDMLDHEQVLLRRRAKLLVYALRLGYTALGGFAAEALIAVIGGVLSYSTYAHLSWGTGVVALAIGVLSVTAFVLSCAYMVRETMIALENLEHEAATVLHHASREDARLEQAKEVV